MSLSNSSGSSSEYQSNGEVDEPPLPFSPITSSDGEASETTLATCSENEIVTTEMALSADACNIISQLPSTDESGQHLPLYKIVGDNVDKNIVPHYMRTDQKVKSLHYYHCYTVRDRINMADLSPDRPSLCLPSPDEVASSLLPQSVDDDILYENIKILLSRILVDTLFFFEVAFSDLTVKHIHHKRYLEMSSKSIIVSYTMHVYMN